MVETLVAENDSSSIRPKEIEAALLRAAMRARWMAAVTGTPLVLVRDGKIIEEYVSRDELEHLPVPKGPRMTEAPF